MKSQEWWRIFFDAMEFNGLHHWEAEIYADEMTYKSQYQNYQKRENVFYQFRE